MEEFATILNAGGAWFWRHSTAMLLQSSILIILLLVVDLLIRQRVRAVVRYGLWLLVMIKLLLPATLSTAVSIGAAFGNLWSPTLEQSAYTQKAFTDTRAVAGLAEVGAGSEPRVETKRAQTGVSDPGYRAVAQASAPAVVFPTLSWQGYVFMAWGIILLFLLGLLIQRVWFVKGLIRQAERIDTLTPARKLLPGERLQELFGECCRQIGVNPAHVTVKISPNPVSPAVCGLIRPTILLPAYLIRKVNEIQLRSVFLHELAHIKRHDLPVNAVQTLLQIAYFYNPLLWLANALIRRVREQAVDEAVLVALGSEARGYSHTLLDIAEMAFQRPALSLRLIGVVESKKALTQRIRHILSRPLPKSARVGLLAFSLIIITAAVVLPMAGRSKGSNDSAEIDAETTQEATTNVITANMTPVLPFMVDNALFPDMIVAETDTDVQPDNSIRQQYTAVRQALADTMEKGRNKDYAELPLQQYQHYTNELAQLAAQTQDLSIQEYAQRWLILLDWLTGQQNGEETAGKLQALADSQSQPEAGNFTRAYAMTVLLRSGNIEEAKKIFGTLEPGTTPRWPWFAFVMNRLYHEQIVEMKIGDLDSQAQQAKTDAEWQVMEQPLREALTGYADWLEYTYLPAFDRYIRHENARNYTETDLLNLAGLPRELLRNWLLAFNRGATTDTIKKQVEETIVPKVLALKQAAIDYLPQEDKEAHRAELKQWAEKYGVGLDSLPEWRERIASRPKITVEPFGDGSEGTWIKVDNIYYYDNPPLPKYKITDIIILNSKEKQFIIKDKGNNPYQPTYVAGAFRDRKAAYVHFIIRTDLIDPVLSPITFKAKVAINDSSIHQISVILIYDTRLLQWVQHRSKQNTAMTGMYTMRRPTTQPDRFEEKPLQIVQREDMLFIILEGHEAPLEQYETGWRFTTGDIVWNKDRTGKELEWFYLGYDEGKKVPYLYDKDAPEDRLYLERVNGTSGQPPYSPLLDASRISPSGDNEKLSSPVRAPISDRNIKGELLEGQQVAQTQGVPDTATFTSQGSTPENISLSSIDAYTRTNDAGQIDYIYFRSNLTEETAVLLRSLPQVREIYFEKGPIKPTILKSLASLPWLRSVNLYEKGITDADAEYLGVLTNLTELGLSGNRLTDAGLAHLAGLTKLRYLNISHTIWVNSDMRITDAGLRHLTGMKELRNLSLSGLPISAKGLKHIQQCSKLEILGVSGDTFDDEAVAMLRAFPRLKTLGLPFTAVSDAGLAQLTNLPMLTSLNLDSTVITDTGLQHLGNLTGLEDLELRVGGLTDKGLQPLQRLPRLKSLNLYAGLPPHSRGENISAAGLRSIRNIPVLEHLSLLNMHISDAMLVEIMQMKKVKNLDVMFTNLAGDADKVTQLQRSLPDTEIMASSGGFVVKTDADNSQTNAANWGQSINGLQVGLAFELGERDYTVGEKVLFTLYVRNVGSNNISLTDYVPMLGWAPKIKDADGKPVFIQTPQIDMPVQPRQTVLNPGQVKKVGTISVVLDPAPQYSGGTDNRGTVVPGTWYVSQTYRFDRVNPGDWEGELTTGTLTLKVNEAETPVPPIIKGKVLGEQQVGQTQRTQGRAKPVSLTGMDVYTRTNDAGQIEEVYFLSNVTDETVVLLRSLRQVREVYFEKGPIPVAILQCLASLPELRRVTLNQKGITDEDAKYLSMLTNLTELNLSGNALTDAGLAHLSGLTKLRYLSISHTSWINSNMRITDDGLRHLGAMKNLRSLSLNGLPISAQGLKHLKECTRLEILEVSGDTFDDEALAVMRVFPRLRSLGLQFTAVSDAGLMHLTNQPGLKSLSLDSTEITDKGMDHVSQLSGLEYLDLRVRRLTDTGLKPLRNLPTLKNLHVSAGAGPHSRGENITAEGLGYIRSMPALEELWLVNMHISDAMFDEIIQMKKLKMLDLMFTDLLEDEVRMKQLRSALPDTLLVESASKSVPVDSIQTDMASWGKWLDVLQDKNAVILPSGVVIALTGVSHYPTEGQVWWRPDGTACRQELFDGTDINILSSISESRIPMVLAFTLGGSVGGNGSDVMIKTPDGAAWAGRQTKNGIGDETVKAIVVKVPKEAEVRDFPLEIAAGPWQTVLTADDQSALSIDDLYREAESLSKSNIQVRVVAVDLKGNTYDIVQKEKVWEMPDIRSIQLQTRPYEKGVFKNVSLKAGYMTDPVVRVGDSLEEQQARQVLQNSQGKKRTITCLGVDITDVPATTNRTVLSVLFEEIPELSGRYQLRSDVIVTRDPEQWTKGVVYYVPASNMYYLVREPGHPGTGSRTFYGPISGDPWQQLSLPQQRQQQKKVPPRFGIYLVAEALPANEYDTVDITTLRLAPEPLIGEEDISEYAWDTHTVTVKPGVKERVPAASTWGIPFVVVADGQRCYLGAFGGIGSSYLPKVPVSYGYSFDKTISENTIIIEPAPLRETEDQKPDVRNDERIRNALERELVKTQASKQTPAAPVAKGEVEGFTPVQRMVVSRDTTDRNGMCFIDFDSATVYQAPFDVTLNETNMFFIALTVQQERWIEENGIDMAIQLRKDSWAELGFRMQRQYIAPGTWQQTTLEEIKETYRALDTKGRVISKHPFSAVVSGYSENHEQSFSFRTREKLLGKALCRPSYEDNSVVIDYCVVEPEALDNATKRGSRQAYPAPLVLRGMPGVIWGEVQTADGLCLPGLTKLSLKQKAIGLCEEVYISNSTQFAFSPVVGGEYEIVIANQSPGIRYERIRVEPGTPVGPILIQQGTAEVHLQAPKKYAGTKVIIGKSRGGSKPDLYTYSEGQLDDLGQYQAPGLVDGEYVVACGELNTRGKDDVSKVFTVKTDEILELDVRVPQGWESAQWKERRIQKAMAQTGIHTVAGLAESGPGPYREEPVRSNPAKRDEPARAQQTVLEQNKAMVPVVISNIARLSHAINILEVDIGRYPTEQEGLAILIRNPGIAEWRGPYVKGEGLFVDSWGSSLTYLSGPGESYRIVSAGPDKKFGTSDDIMFDPMAVITNTRGEAAREQQTLPGQNAVIQRRVPQAAQQAAGSGFSMQPQVPVLRRDARKLFRDYVAGRPLPESDVTGMVDTFPIFSWADIPVLLELAESTNRVPENGRIPVMMISSYLPPRSATTEGIVALYFIEGLRGKQSEAVRYNQLGNTNPPRSVYYTPLTAVCWDTERGGTVFENINDPARVVAAQRIAMAAYSNWWATVKYLPPEDAALFNPLDGTGIAWYGYQGYNALETFDPIMASAPVNGLKEGALRHVYEPWTQPGETGKLLRTLYYEGSFETGFKPVGVKVYYYDSNGRILRTRMVPETYKPGETEADFPIYFRYVLRSRETFPGAQEKSESRDWWGEWMTCKAQARESISFEARLEDGSALHVSGKLSEANDENGFCTISDLSWSIEPLDPTHWLNHVTEYVASVSSSRHSASVSSHRVFIGDKPDDKKFINSLSRSTKQNPMKWVGSGYSGTLNLCLDFCVPSIINEEQKEKK